jgi:hypothetical protein
MSTKKRAGGSSSSSSSSASSSSSSSSSSSAGGSVAASQQPAASSSGSFSSTAFPSAMSSFPVASSSGAGGMHLGSMYPPAQAGMSGPQAGTKTEVLADIFNKIAEFEVTKSDADYMQMMLSLQLEAEERSAVEQSAAAEFNKFLGGLMPLFQGGTDCSRSKEIETFFDAKFVELESLESSFSSRLPEFKNLCRKESGLAADKNSLLHAIELNDMQVKELQEICRTAQKKNKESMEEVEKVRQAGINRTFSLGQSCQSSIDDVLGSLQSEEESIKKKEEENEDLSKKLTEFKAHLAAHSKQLQAQKRAVDLQSQLIAAKKSQVGHHNEQCRLLSGEYSSRLVKQYEALDRLREQVYLYKSKFAEFESSIEDTKKVFAHFEARAKEASSRALELEDGTSKILKKAEAKHNELDRLKEERVQVDDEKVAIDKDCSELEKLCRSLATERMALNKALKDLQVHAGTAGTVDDKTMDTPRPVTEEANTVPVIVDTSGLVNLSSVKESLSAVDSEVSSLELNNEVPPLPSLSSQPPSSSQLTGDTGDSQSGRAPSSSSSSSSSSSFSRRGATTPLSPGED